MEGWMSLVLVVPLKGFALAALMSEIAFGAAAVTSAES